jgi:hypothetical protein
VFVRRIDGKTSEERTLMLKARPAGGCRRILQNSPPSPGNFFQLSLFELFLTFDAMPCPGHRFQALGIYFPATRDAFSELAFAHARQCPFDHLQQLAVVIALMKQELLGIGARGAVRNVLRRILIHGPAILFDTRHHAAELALTRFQSILEVFEFLFVHDIAFGAQSYLTIRLLLNQSRLNQSRIICAQNEMRQLPRRIRESLKKIIANAVGRVDAGVSIWCVSVSPRCEAVLRWVDTCRTIKSVEACFKLLVWIAKAVASV